MYLCNYNFGNDTQEIRRDKDGVKLGHLDFKSRELAVEKIATQEETDKLKRIARILRFEVYEESNV